MAAFVPTKMKRKDIEDDVFDDFADSSLAAPARKIRRLNPVTCISVSVNTEIYPDLKYQLSSRPGTTTLHAAASRDDLAVIPWVLPSHPPAPDEVAEGGSASDAMEYEEMGTQMEEDNPTADGVLKLQPAGITVEGAQWQHHCMASHPPQRPQ